MTVTLSGAIGSTSYTLDYHTTNAAYNVAVGLTALIDSVYSSAWQYEPGQASPHFGAVVIGDAVAHNKINVKGFGAVIDENNTTRSTLFGGGYQIVLAGDGGLDFYSSSGNVTVDAGGGNNKIMLSGDADKTAIYLGHGNDTTYTGQGNATVQAGGGHNVTHLGAGNDYVKVGGEDTVYLGSGSDTVVTNPYGSVTIVGANQSTVANGYSLQFIGGELASTVLAGAGRYSIFGGAGGGLFQGGTSGGNFIQAGSGNATILGGGANDTLLGGSGYTLIEAGRGNETLGGGSGHTVFDFNTDVMRNAPGATIKIEDFTGNDKIELSGGAAAIDQALHSYSATTLGATFTLQDGTQVTLLGYHGTLNSSDFKS